MNTRVSGHALKHGNPEGAGYGAFLASVNAAFLINIEDGKTPLFTTDAEGLLPAYLDALDAAAKRQYSNCHACGQFVARFGALVTIDANGMTAPALWREDEAPDAYKPAMARVTGVFLASEAVWGRPETGVWRHLAATPPAAMVFKHATQSAGQAMAEKREDFKTLMHALNEFAQPVIEQALTLLRTEALYRSEKVLGQAAACAAPGAQRRWRRPAFATRAAR